MPQGAVSYDKDGNPIQSAAQPSPTPIASSANAVSYDANGDPIPKRQSSPGTNAVFPRVVPETHLRGPLTGMEKLQRQFFWTVDQLPAIGGIAGAVATGPESGFLASGLGAAGGGMVGERVKHYIDALTGRKPLPTQTEALKQMGGAGVEQGLMEVGGRAIAAPVVKALGGVYRSAVAGSAETQAVKALNEKAGLGLSAPEVAGVAPIGRATQRMGTMGIAGHGAAEAARVATDAAAVKELDATLAKLGPKASSVEVGDAMQKAIKVSKQAFQRKASSLYEAADALTDSQTKRVRVTKEVPILDPVTKQPLLYKSDGTPLSQMKSVMERQEVGGVQFNTRPVRRLVLQMERDLQEIIPTLKKTGGDSSKLIQIIEAYKDLPSTLSFSAAQDLRSNLLADLRSVKNLMPGAFKGTEKRMASVFLDEMTRAATAAGPDVVAAVKAANEFYAKGAQLFGRDSVSSPMAFAKSPETLVKMLKDGSVSDVRAIKQTLFDYLPHASPAEQKSIESTWDAFRQQYIRSSILDAPHGTPNLEVLKTRLSEVSPDVLETVFGDAKGKAVLQNMRTLGDALSRRVKPISGGYHQFWEYLSLGTALATGNVAHGAEVAGTMEVAPWMLTKIMASPKATRFLLEGVGQMPKGAKAAGPYFLRAAKSAMEFSNAMDDQQPYPLEKPSGIAPLPPRLIER